MKEIEDAIRALSPKDRAQLADDLPELLPELNDDSEWRRIINDPRSRPNLSAFIDKIDAKMKSNPEAFPEITDADFERNV